jgi:hypothetical protein
VPSSLIFAGLVATWLAVLVPMAARRRQQTPRPSDAALSCRVLERPRRLKHRRTQEVTTMDEAAEAHTRSAPEPDGEARYRPGRGGYDPEAAALAAQAKYAFRQRMVLVLVLFAFISAALAITLRMREAWWLHAAVDLCLIGYLVYLRQQVRIEQAIRARRAARGAGTRRGPLTDDHKFIDTRLDADPSVEYQGTAPRRGGRTVADAVAERAATRREPSDAAARGGSDGEADGEAEPAPVAEPRDDLAPQQPGLAPLPSTPMPLPPPGTSRLELDDEDPDLHDLAAPQPRGYRRAAGQ